MKRLYRFILLRFLPLFAMTFFIVLFIVLMQFLWRYIDDLVGKGLSVGLLGELFFYAAVSMVPMALPLAILLASLMTFGNLGEKSELTAIKAAGVPLIKTMSPLIVFISLVSVGAFFFQNDVLPRAQVKMWTLLFSARQKSPELEIPEGAFYDQIPGYNLFVRHKNRDTGMLYDVMIYDVGHGGDQPTTLVADSGRLAFTKDLKYLYLHLYNGEQFENLRQQRVGEANVPFRRETFLDKEILIPFDNNFNRLDEGGMRSQYVGKNIAELRQSLDSLQNRIDSIGLETEREFTVGNLFKPTTMAQLSLDSLLQSLSPTQLDATFAAAQNGLQRHRMEYEFRAIQIADENNRYRRHQIELIKKFTLSVACLVFLFIGAPLGAIIRKGGIGTPLVISVLLFLVYYIIDNTGYKLARDGRWVVWCGMWLSTFVLLPLGIFVTYKAMNDSSVFNADLYKSWLRRRLGLPEKRAVAIKEVIINDINAGYALALVQNVWMDATEWLSTHRRRPGYVEFWRGAYAGLRLDRIGEGADRMVEYLSDSKSPQMNAALNRVPATRDLWVLCPAGPRVRRLLMWFAPIGALLYLFALPYARRVYNEVSGVVEAEVKIASLLS